MKKIYQALLIVIAFTINTNAQDSLSVVTNPTSDSINCNGSAYFADTMIFFNNPSASWYWSDQNNQVIQQGGFSQGGLCEGVYTVTYSDSIGNQTISFVVGSTFSNPCANFYANIQANSVSSPNNCDGYAIASITGGTSPYTYNWGTTNNTSSNLCAGTYTVTISDANSCTTTNSFTITDSTVFNPTLTGTTYPNPTSAEGQCDGSVYVSVYGGEAPYTFSHSNGSTIQNPIDLCSGIQSALIIDAIGDSIVVNYIIPNPNDLINGGNYQDSTLTDTLTYTIFEDCNIDYISLDSVYVSAINYLGNDSLSVIWSILSANNITTFTQLFSITTGNGVYELLLQIFCPQRAGNEYIYAVDRIYYNPTLLKTKTIEKELDVKSFPNPFSNEITINLGENIYSIVTISDITGKVVFTQNLNQQISKISTETWSKGQYILQIENENNTKRTKLIK